MPDSVPTVNRMVVVVSPKEPYREWARSLDDDEATIDIMEVEELTTAYLIDENDTPEQHWEWMFEEQLNSWSRLPEEWPRERTYPLFQEWFEVQAVDLVYDLGKSALCQED